MAASFVVSNIASEVKCCRQFRGIIHLNRRLSDSGCGYNGKSLDPSKLWKGPRICGIVSSFDNVFVSAVDSRTATIPLFAHKLYCSNTLRSMSTVENTDVTCSPMDHVRCYPVSLSTNVADISGDQASNSVLSTEKECCSKNVDLLGLCALQSSLNSCKKGIAFIGIFAALFFKKEKEEESVEMFVGKAVASEKRGHMGKAEDFYHLAVKLALEEKRPDKVVYIYDMMANFYLRINKFLKAEQLFKETIKLLLEAGFQEHDPAVLETSLKLAGIYDLQFRYTEAEAGFHFCVSKAEDGLKIYKEKGEENREQEMNLYAMLGVSLDAYGKFMLKRKKFAVAEEAYIRAIKICENELSEEGKPHPQTATLLNDLGTVYEEMKEYKKAMEAVCRAEGLAKDSPDNLAVILCNKATLHLRNDEREQATTLFRQALRLAERSQDEETIRFVRIAMSKLAAPLKKAD